MRHHEGFCDMKFAEAEGRKVQDISPGAVAASLCFAAVWLCFCVWLNLQQGRKSNIADTKDLVQLVEQINALDFGLCPRTPSPLPDIRKLLKEGSPISTRFMAKAKEGVASCAEINRLATENRRLAKIQEDALKALEK